MCFTDLIFASVCCFCSVMCYKMHCSNKLHPIDDEYKPRKATQQEIEVYNAHLQLYGANKNTLT